ncbi:MAG: RDD family protein [Proteobacteria bacterium]|nr:MAG: RDD family protein [Pseudomonadota bacterium]
MQQAKKVAGYSPQTEITGDHPAQTIRSHQLAIRTGEGIVFRMTLAGPVARCLAWMVDAFCIAATAKIIGTLVSTLGMFSQDLSQAASILVFFLLNLGYSMVLEWFWHGQTVGKRLLCLRVMDIQGLELQVSQIAIRNLLRAVDSLPLLYLVGGVTALINRRGQRLGDIAANTVVIRITKPELRIPDDFLEAVHYNSLRDYPLLVARLRQRTTPAEAALAMQALIRRDELSADARVALFQDIAAHLQAKTDFPTEATENISDEQLVRNAVDVLFQHNVKKALYHK